MFFPTPGKFYPLSVKKSTEALRLQRGEKTFDLKKSQKKSSLLASTHFTTGELTCCLNSVQQRIFFIMFCVLSRQNKIEQSIQNCRGTKELP